MDNLWIRLNSLVPEPNCEIRENVIVEWNDDRPQPAESELLSVDVDAAINEIKEKNNAKEELRRIDANSIRSIREFLLAKFKDDDDMPEYLSEHESEAIEQRSKL